MLRREEMEWATLWMRLGVPLQRVLPLSCKPRSMATCLILVCLSLAPLVSPHQRATPRGELLTVHLTLLQMHVLESPDHHHQRPRPSSRTPPSRQTVRPAPPHEGCIAVCGLENCMEWHGIEIVSHLMVCKALRVVWRSLSG